MNAKNHQLTLVAEGDHRGAVAGGQAFVKTAPVSLVLISDLSRFGDAKSARSQLMGAMDSGIVSQNISIFCSAANIGNSATRFDGQDQMKKVLKLKDSQMPMMNHPVGTSNKDWQDIQKSDGILQGYRHSFSLL